jgi:hypothetical protein
MNQLEGFPQEIVDKMLEHQVAQGNEKNIKIFENYAIAGYGTKGFGWNITPEGHEFWREVIINKRFDIFFQKYPKLTLPRFVEVSHSGLQWYKRVLVLERIVNDKKIYYCVYNVSTLEAINKETELTNWKYMREIEEPKVTELTLDEIAQKFNIPVEQLKIKK